MCQTRPQLRLGFPFGCLKYTMRYHTLHRLLESQFDPEERLEACANLILDKAKPWLNAIGGVNNLDKYILYRGMSSNTPSEEQGFVMNHRRHQQPRVSIAMPPDVKAAWQKSIHGAGKVADRENSLLCTGEALHADTFGSVMVIIPLGEFNYTWIEGIDDLNNWWWFELGDAGTEHMEDDEAERMDMMRERFLNGELDLTIRGDDNSMKEALRDQAEIMLHVKDHRYIAIRPDFYDELTRMMVAQ